MSVTRSFCRQAGLCAALLLYAFSRCLSAGTIYSQDNLVSDVSGLANTLDPNLKNPWGVSFAAQSPFWVSDQATSVSTLYDGAGNVVPLVVTIPKTGFPNGPTGQVFNGNRNSFILPDNSAALFLFVTLDGQLTGWNPGTGTAAVNVATTAGAVYTGLALGNVGPANYLYAADQTGHIDVFDSGFKNVTNTIFAGKFVDKNALPGFNPFNIQDINGDLYVTYAKTVLGIGQPGGFVDEFDSRGNLLKRIATSGSLYAPWGITLAPSKFGSFSGDLLIGQFGNGEILAYNPSNDAFLGTLNGKNGQPIINPFLWALDVRTGGTAVNLNAVYFTSGYNNQKDGLFGAITVAPEPGTITLFLAAVGSLGTGHLVRRRKRLSSHSA